MARKGRAGAALVHRGGRLVDRRHVRRHRADVLAPPLATIALKFGPPEYTALLTVGLIFLAYMSSASLSRTLLMACFGLLLGTIGIDP